MIEQPPRGVIGSQVGLIAVTREVQGPCQVGLDLVEARRGAGEALGDRFQLPGDAVLLDLEKLERYGTCVMSLQQFGLRCLDTALGCVPTERTGSLALVIPFSMPINAAPETAVEFKELRCCVPGPMKLIESEESRPQS